MTQHTHHPYMVLTYYSVFYDFDLKMLFFMSVSSNNHPIQDNPYAYFNCFADSLEGVPPYPLYKCLASALLRCMHSETFCRTGANLAMCHEFEDSSAQQKQQEWHKLILEKGFEIVNVNNDVLTHPFVHLFDCIS